MRGKSADLAGSHRVRVAFAPTTQVPVFIAATGPRMLKCAGALADGVILMNGVHPDLIGPALEKMHTGAVEADRDPADIRVVVWTAGAVSDDDPVAAGQMVKYNVARAIMRHMPGEDGAEVGTVRAAVASHYKYSQHGDPEADVSSLIPDELVSHYAFVGTSDDVVVQVERLEQLVVNEIAIAVPRTSGLFSLDRALDSFAAALL